MSTLPIYRLAKPDVSAQYVIDVASAIFDIAGDFKLSETHDRLVLTSGTRVVDVSVVSGAIWAADEAHLFNASVRPTLPDPEQALSIAKDYLASRKLLPELGDKMSFGSPHVAGTKLALLTDGERFDHDLDVQVVVPILVGGLPLVGGGGDFTVVFGDGGRPIGFHGLWRSAEAAFESVVLSEDAVIAEYKKTFDGLEMQLESLQIHMAYHSAPASERQEFLYPVYCIGGTARLGDELIQLRVATYPATEFGPVRPSIEPESKRPPRAKPPVTKPKERHGKLGPLGARKNYSTAASLVAASSGQLAATKPWEAGASWIGASGGLAGSKKNAQGFIDEWRDDGWIIDFNWGDANAFESDWRRNDDQWVDNADFVFYTGHANMNGWVLSAPDDTFLHFNEVGNGPERPGDMWGQNDLEWVVVAACGPLQDQVISAGGGSVLDRWDGAFDGLHLLMGYGSVTNDNESEGRSLARYARGGMTLKDAWFRTAKEIQPATNNFPPPDGPTVWVGVMWVTQPGADPINDHAWSHGSVSADPNAPTTYACMWTVC